MPPGREATKREPRPAVTLAPAGAGRAVIVTSFVGTLVLAVTAVAAAIAPDALDVPALVVALVMFFGGTAAFAWAYAVAVSRSRTAEIAVGGVYGLGGGSTPAAVRAQLLGSLAAEVAIAVATAAARPYTSLSFGILAPMWGLGFAGVWGARHGGFPPRAPDPRRPGARIRRD
jgi:hypothetical protein